MLMGRFWKEYRPLKHIKRRIVLWLLLSILGLLIDEYLKEGYIFDVSDVLKPLTHENIIVILLGILLIYTFLKRYLKFA